MRQGAPGRTLLLGAIVLAVLLLGFVAGGVYAEHAETGMSATPPGRAGSTAGSAPGGGEVARAEALLGELAPAALAGRLDGRKILLVVTPDVAPQVRERLDGYVRAAGGQLAGTVTLTDSLLSGERADAVRGAVVGALPAGVELRAGPIDPGTVAGDYLGAGFQLRDGRPQTDQAGRETIARTLVDGGYIDFERGTLVPGDLALVVSGPTGAGVGTRPLFLARFAEALARRGGGVVLAGPAEDSGNGTLHVVRGDAASYPGVGTVEGVDGLAGAVNAVRSLTMPPGRPSPEAASGPGPAVPAPAG